MGTLSKGFNAGAKALVTEPRKAYQRGASPSTVLAKAVTSLPRAAAMPASAVAAAVKQTLTGVRNGLDPDKDKLRNR